MSSRHRRTEINLGWQIWKWKFLVVFLAQGNLVGLRASRMERRSVQSQTTIVFHAKKWLFLRGSLVTFSLKGSFLAWTLSLTGPTFFTDISVCFAFLNRATVRHILRNVFETALHLWVWKNKLFSGHLSKE